MKNVKGNIDLIIHKINFISKFDKYQNYQIEINDNKINASFLKFLSNISDFIFIDKLESGDIRRKSENLSLDDVIHKAETGIACGIKVVKNPISNLYEWEKWEDGYIEGFCRMDSDNKDKEWFVFIYIKMENLKKILKSYEDHLFLLNDIF